MATNKSKKKQNRILVVEDDPAVCELLLDVLTPEFEVESAPSLARAKERLLNADYDLILADVGLPDGDGYRVHAYAQQSQTNRKTPIIFATGRAEIGDKVFAFALGAADYVCKPFNIKELLARVRAGVLR